MKRIYNSTMDYLWNIMWITFGLLLVLKETYSHPRFQENYIEEDKFLPNFVTLGQKYSIALGSTVVLPCKINETEHSNQYVLAWIRNRAVLTAGNVKATVNPRIRLMPLHEVSNSEPHTSSYNLEIRDVRLTDAGEYACQIGSMEPKEIIHTLEVLVPPKIQTVDPSTRVDVSKGASIRLECRAEGNPPPKIVWTRKNNVMPNGEPNITSNVLEMMHADRHTVGYYRCTADNRVGQADTKDIHVNVMYAPEIEVERPFVHTGVGYEAQLTCTIHAEPQPHVIWYKDTTQLGTTEQHSQQSRGNRYSLIIRNVTHNDLGNYTCQGSNSLGKDRASLTLSGLATICVFDSPTLSNFRDQYNISWTVQSYSPIREYRLFYRKQPGQRGHTGGNGGHQQHDKLDNHIGTNFYPGTTYTTGGGSGLTGTGSIGTASFPTYGGGGSSSPGGLNHEHEQWENVVIPEVYSGHSGLIRFGTYGYTGVYSGHGGGLIANADKTIHNNLNENILSAVGGENINDIGGASGILGSFDGGSTLANRNHNIRRGMSYIIRNLTPASNYEARVQARNDHGWNKQSSVFHFSTRAEDLELEPSAQPAVSKIAGVLDKDLYGSSSSGTLQTNSLERLLPLSSNRYVNSCLSIFFIVCAFLSL